MPDKISDNEIVKALEYWKQFDKEVDTLYASHPQYANMWDEQKEVVKITFEVFEEVNRQKAELEMNDTEIKELQIALQGCLDDVAKTRNLYKQSVEELNKAKAEIERLKENEVIADGYADALVEYTKAEAYKEFAEKVNKMLNSRASFGNLIESIMCERIVKEVNNILKKLVGDENEGN